MSPCRHPDVRSFGDVRCCLSCGEPVIDAPEETHDNSKPSRYRYKRLDYEFGQEIRLIQVLPGEWSDDIECQHIHVDLTSAPASEAVSYTWADLSGDVSLCRSARCSEQEILVTLNCESVLRRIRHQRRDRTIWLDAVSIDQSNALARNHQVRLMATIYSNASQVLACADPNQFRHYELISWLKKRTSSTSDIRERPYSQIDTSVLRLPYFDRIWVCCLSRLAMRATRSFIS